MILSAISAVRIVINRMRMHQVNVVAEPAYIPIAIPRITPAVNVIRIQWIGGRG